MISSLLINFLLFWMITTWLDKKDILSKYRELFFKFVVLIALIWFVTTVLLYLLTPLFYDHTESNIASVAAVWSHGGNIYTVLDAPGRYSLLYGPWPYIVTAAFESMGAATIFWGKLPGVLNAFFVLIGIFIVAKHRKFNNFESILITGTVALSLLGFYNYSYWNRPDSYLVLYVLWSLLAVEFLSESNFELLIYAVVGLLMGLSINCKVHSAFYFLPVWMYYWETSKKKLNVPMLVVAAMFCLLAALGPFFLSNINLTFYIEWLKMAAKHGILIDRFIYNISFILSFLILLYALRFPRKYVKTYIVLCASCFCIAIFGAKVGAGTHHFMPLISVIILWVALMLREPSFRFKPAIAAFIAMLALVAFNKQKHIVVWLSQTAERIKEFDDLKSIADQNPGSLELGYAGIEQYDSSFYKPWLVQHGRGLLIDGAALMDMKASGIEVPKATIDVIESCSIKTMVFPKGGEPWSLTSFYDDKNPLISDEMRSAFYVHYGLKEQTAFFQIWKCKAKVDH